MEGQQVGHYRIIEKIGEGGMGVVYRAEDTRLKRSVALKFLPPDLTRSAEARERFIHEAQAASALDHPNICTIYEIDETDEGQIYLVMGLYEGQTLREKITERPLKLEDAIEITSQIARGLARAHENGIIHRDIKPANIFITNGGEVRILDFGLAKLHGQTKLTLTGTTLGTVSYMAPEQATGAEADHRADIWSLGVLMYEMLTGQQPFRGEHEQAVIYSILNEEPEPITALRTGIPLDLEWVVQKTLRKDPLSRYQHIDEIPVDLGTISDHSPEIRARTASRETGRYRFRRWRSRPSRSLPFVAVLLLIVGYLLRGLIQQTSGTSAEAPAAFQVTPPAGVTIPSAVTALYDVVALDPDGGTLVFTGQQDGINHLYRRGLGSVTSERISGSEGAMAPFYSPDGRRVGFLADGYMKYVPIEGGDAVSLCSVPEWFTQPFWGTDDMITFTDSWTTLKSFPADGGDPQTILEVESDYEVIEFPYPLSVAGGDAVIYSMNYTEIRVLHLESGTQDSLTEGSMPRLSGNGYLLFLRSDELWAAPFDERRLALKGDPRRVLTGISEYEVSRDGTLVYVPSAEGMREVVLVTRAGQAEPMMPQTGYFCYPRYSPDYQRLAITDSRVLWVYNVERGSGIRLTDDSFRASDPLWSPDGRWIVFAGHKPEETPRSFHYRLYRIASDGSGEPELILERPYPFQDWPKEWVPGREAWLTDSTSREWGRGTDILLVEQVGDSVSPRPLLNSQFDELSPALSPDGNWLVYCSNESGVYEVYVQRFPDLGDKRNISSGGGSGPVWSRDGRELYFRRGDAMMVVEVETGDTFIAGSPRVLMRGPFTYNRRTRPYDIDRHGGFLMLRPVDHAVGSQIRVITNWARELESMFSPGM